jgi:inorganic pyrophosphatase
VVGGIQAIDGGEADDKIVAVLDNDEFWRDVEDISQVPNILVERLRHYFSTYKMMPGGTSQMSIKNVYDCEVALQVVSAAMEDYGEAYGV